MQKQRQFVCLTLDNQDSSLLETPINDYLSLFERLDNEGMLIVNIIDTLHYMTR